jgi:hypothetical protein
MAFLWIVLLIIALFVLVASAFSWYRSGDFLGFWWGWCCLEAAGKVLGCILVAIADACKGGDS